MSFWDRPLEFKSLIICCLTTVIMGLATMCLFWFGYPEICLGLITSGVIVTISWLVVYLYRKKHPEPKVKIDVIFIYIRLFLIVTLAIIFAILQLTIKLVIISPIYLIVGYFVISMVSLSALIRKDKKEKKNV